MCAGCAIRSVGCARCARESLAGRDMRAYGAGEAAEPPTAQQTTPKSRSGISSKTTSRVRFLTARVRLFRFASVAKQFPKEADELFLAARARLFRCRSGERPVALQELPQNARHAMVII